METETKAGLKKVIQLFEDGQPEQAQKVISDLFEIDIESKEVAYANKCCIFWIDAIKRLQDAEDSYVQSENILSEWRAFQNFISHETFVYEPVLYAVQKGFFSSALFQFLNIVDGIKDSFQRADIYRKAGICYKKLGDFENARNCLTEANNTHPNLASVLAELADCYSLCGDDRVGKVLFREAFFKAPEFIELDFLDSELIKCLITQTREKGFEKKEQLYWIPVYGVLNGVFNVKRELTSQEAGQLRKNIYAMENEFKDPACNAKILVPKMLNHYFWLIDHYVLSHESAAKINEVLLKIKLLDSSIYEAYIK